MNRDVLLDSKTIAPALRPNLVSRTRLLRRLEAGLAVGREVTLVSAPAGFGKTTLLSEWAHRAERPASWLTLEESENDPVLFLRYLVESIRKSVPAVSPIPLQLLQSPQGASPLTLLAPLLNDLAASEKLLLILDDYHLVTAPASHAVVEFLLDHLPPSVHLALGTREDPPLPLARLRARDRITELRESDLRFTLTETEEFLARTTGLKVPAAAETLEARTEGWVAGLQLAAFALQKERAQPEKFLAAFSGDHRYVMDYLVVEVLERLPEEIRAFLRRTSILDRLSAPLCDAVLDGSGSQALLEQLEASNIFLFPLDERREWYRYHRLFAEFLKARLAPEEEGRLHERAAAWFESHRMPSLAVRHALAAGALSGDYVEAARLIRLAAEDGIREGRAQTLIGWLDSLPKDLLYADPELALYKGWALTLGGDFSGAEALAGRALRILADRTGFESTRGKAFLLQAFLALMARMDYPETIRLATRAIEDLRGREDQWLPMAYWLLAEPHERMGRVEQAIRTLQESRQALPASLSHLFTDLVDMMLVYDLNLAGRRREALAVCEETIRQRASFGETGSPTSCMLLARRAMLYYEADDIERASALYAEALEYGIRHRQEPFVSFARGICAPILLARGEADSALEALDRAAALARQTGLTDVGTILAAQAGIRLRLGRLDQAARWAEEAGCSTAEEPQYIRLDSHLVFTRWLIVRGAHAEAVAWLEKLRAFLETGGMRRPLITARILSALLAERTGDPAAARGFLERALQAAAPENYLRAFLDEEERLFGLLPSVRGAEAPFVDRLVSARNRLASRPIAKPAAEDLPEPLSPREIEILLLIAKGLSNAQIAERLVIALATVKRHAQNIFGKLGVNSRTQAVAEGRRRGLIG
ncbi:MAG: AAA family ATPase [Anaerolineales bacterium]|nr:AAA family ATPase [Anaerolineales bacterium]